MKKTALVLALRRLAAVSLAVCAASASAAGFTSNGTVHKIYSVDRANYGAGDPFTVAGFTSAGGCVTNDGLVGIYFADDEGGRRQLGMVLMARAMGWTLHVRVDDNHRNVPGGGCKLLILEVERN